MVLFLDERLFIIDMDLVNGMSVEKMLAESFITVNESLEIIRNILFAVEFSHLQGIIHRDIKPANILIDNGIPKLADFGLSIALGEIVTPWQWYIPHAAPETFVDDSVATIQTDIFALGMTLYRMVNGVSNWREFLDKIPNARELMRVGRLIEKLSMDPMIPDKVVKIIKKACNKNPEKRYRTAKEMRNAIERLKPWYNWKKESENSWIGWINSNACKKIVLDNKRNKVKVTVYNNDRRSSSDSKDFNNLVEAESYLFDYIKSTTFK